MGKTVKFIKSYGAWIILAVNTAVIAVIILSDPDFAAGFIALEKISPRAVALCFGVSALAFLFEGAQLKLILAMFGQKYPLWASIRSVITERYYSSITPTSIGGQPAIILHVMSRGVPGAVASSAMTVRFVLYQFTSVLFLLAAVIAMPFFGIKLTPLVATSLAIGSVGLAGIPVLLILCVIWPELTHKIISLFFGILGKLRIIKNSAALNEKAANAIDRYAASMRMMNMKNAALILVIAFFQFLCLMSVPFFACYACGIKVHYAKSVIMSLVLYTAVGFVPTPGSSGAAEAMFYSLYKEIIPATSIMVILLLWRVSSYYFTISVGIIESCVTAVQSRLKEKRLKLPSPPD